jgi:capsular exopolysaccharide synthesis family protein
MSSISKEKVIPSALLPDHAAFDGGLESEDLSLRQAIKVLRKRQRFILMVTAGILLLIVLASIILPASYQGTSTIELTKDKSGGLTGNLGEVASTLTGGDSDLKTDLQTAISVLQNDQIGVEVLERLHFEDRVADAGLPFWNRGKIPDKDHRLPLRQDPVAREFLLKRFEHNLDVQVVPGTRLLQITYTDGDPKFAAAVANVVVDQYMKDLLNQRNTTTIQASEWMTNQLNDLRKQVEAAQQNLVNFQKKSGFIVVPGTGGGTTGNRANGGAAASPSGSQLHSTLIERLLTLNQTLVQAQANRISEEAIYQVVKTQDPNAIAALATTLSPGLVAGSSGPGGSGQANLLSGLLALRQQQNALKQQLAASFETYGAKNPHVTELRQQVAFLDTEMKEEVVRLLATTASTLKIAQDSEARVRKELAVLEHQADGINDSAVRLAVLQQEADSTRALYEDLYTKLEEARLAEQTQSSNVAVVSDALPAANPHFPNWILNVAIGIVGGLIGGVILAFFKESLDDSIVTTTQIESLTRVPVLGLIPKFELSSNLPASKDQSELATLTTRSGVAMGEPNSQAAEAYRALRTALLLSQPGSPPRTLLVTSPLPAEGKTTTCYNLATCFALMGKRVLIIDADMRKPALHRRTGDPNAMGLSTLLTSSLDPDDLILQHPNVANLSFLSSGPVPPNPTELLASEIFATAIASVSKQYDLVLIDAPPAMLVADPAIISAMVDGVMIVVRAGVTTRLTLLGAVEKLQRSKANVIGVVLNRVNTKSTEYYYTHGYYGGKYYGDNFYGKDKS